MNRGRAASIAGNPVLVGAVTVMVVVVAVFLSFNATYGLPFVPTYEVRVNAPDSGRIIRGNPVREGGYRIGQVDKVAPIRRRDHTAGALITLKLKTSAGPVPSDSTFTIRSKSVLGSKYVELIRGSSKRMLPPGSTVTVGRDAIPPDFSDLFSTFDAKTRRAVQTNLTTFGSGLAGRGTDLSLALGALPPLLRALPPVMETLAAPSTRLAGAIRQLAATAGTLAPVAGTFAGSFTSAANVFGALSSDRPALAASISESPPTLRVAQQTLGDSRPFLRHLAGISGELEATAAEVRRAAPPLTSAVNAGIRNLPVTPDLSRRLNGTSDALRSLAADPLTNLTLDGLRTTTKTATPTARYLGPFVTVCNYWNYFWTYISDAVAQQDGRTGTLLRVEIKTAPPSQQNTLDQFGANTPVQPTPVSPAEQALFGDPASTHGQPYGRAVDPQGNADCENGQRGYPTKLASGTPPSLVGALDPRTPGDQGPTYTGLARVPPGQTFSAEPDGTAPQVVHP